LKHFSSSHNFVSLRTARHAPSIFREYAEALAKGLAKHYKR